MKKFLTKVKNWFIAHKPTKRRLIQVYAALLYNANIKGFVSGKIYTGDTKKVCVPGLNCYSCPGAVGACPLGALQDSLANSNTTVPAYIFGILVLFGLFFGRLICGFLCPFGLIQELLYKIRTPKLRKSRFTRIASYFKYILLILVIAIPLIYAGIPVFCKYVCPAGTFEGALSLLANVQNSSFYQMLGYLFSWKFCVLLAVIVASVFIYRFLCRFICPLGAIYSLFCKISLLGVKLDKDKCINCGLCIQGCKMDIKHVGDHECIQCGECISICPVQAISWKGSQIFVKNTTPSEQPVFEPSEKIDLLALAKANASAAVAPVAESTDTSPESVAAQSVGAVEEEVVTATEAATLTEAKEGETKKQPNKRWSAIKSAFKKPRFVVEFVAWTVALAVLITALVCYNLPEKERGVLPSATVAAYEGGTLKENGYSTYSADKKVKVLYFWRTDLEESVSGLSVLNEYAAECKVVAEFVAVHTIYKDNRNVGEYIVNGGYGDYSLTFAQDDKQSNLYSYFGGDISVPETITVVADASGKIVWKGVGELDVRTLEEQVLKAQSSVVYGVGDICPYFSLKTYASAGGVAGEFSLADCLGKVTILNFWYTSCDPCKAELPFFNNVLNDMSGEINMYAIHSLSAVPPGGVQKWIDENADKNGLAWKDYSIIFAQDEKLNGAELYAMLGGRAAYPVTVVLNAEGRITQIIQGSCSEDALRAAISAAKI